jgi:hypothetical protein
MPDWVRVRLPWWWGWAPERPGTLDEKKRDDVDHAEGGVDALPSEELRRRWDDLHVWVSWFVDHYHLADELPPCWPRHPALVDELNALWHYHQEVTRPFVAMVQPDPVGSPAEPEDPQVPARSYWEWHEARWRWTQGPLRSAPGYHECLTGHRHVEEPDRQGRAAAFTEASRIIVDQLFTDGETEASLPQ